MQRRSGNSDKILQRTDTRDGERERKRERAKQPLSQGFFPTYSLYTTSKRFALWNRLYEIWANLRAACWISKMKTNREAGKRRVGVSAGVYYNLAVGRSWDEDAELTRFSWDAVTSVPSTCDYRWKLLDIFGCQPPFFPVFFFLHAGRLIWMSHLTNWSISSFKRCLQAPFVYTEIYPHHICYVFIKVYYIYIFKRCRLRFFLWLYIIYIYKRNMFFFFISVCFLLVVVMPLKQRKALKMLKMLLFCYLKMPRKLLQLYVQSHKTRSSQALLMPCLAV